MRNRLALLIPDGVYKRGIQQSAAGTFEVRPDPQETSMIDFIRRLRGNESGATAIEYGLIAALIAIFLIGGLTAAGGSLNGILTAVQQSLNNAAGSGNNTGGNGGTP